MSVLVKIDRSSVRRNENAGGTTSFVAGPENMGFDERGKFFIKREVIQVRHFPIPKYSYSYLPATVWCRYCLTGFDHTELREDENDEGEYLTEICPVCGMAQCCEVKYERFDEKVHAGKCSEKK